MPASRGRKRKGRRATSSQSKNKIPPKKRWTATHKVFSGLLVLATLVGGVAAVAYFWPRVSIVVADPTDQSDPFSSKITIASTSPYTLENVSVAIGICKIDAAIKLGIYGDENQKEAVTDCPNRPHTTLLAPPEWQDHRLRPGALYEVFLNEAFGLPAFKKEFKSADISVVVFFRPWFEPHFLMQFLQDRDRYLVAHDEAHYVGTVDPAGHITWRAKTIDRP